MSGHPIPDWLRGQFSRIEDEVHKLGPCGTFTQMRTVTQTYFEQLAESSQAPAVGGEPVVLACASFAKNGNIQCWSLTRDHASLRKLEGEGHRVIELIDRAHVAPLLAEIATERKFRMSAEGGWREANRVIAMQRERLDILEAQIAKSNDWSHLKPDMDPPNP